LKQYVFKGYLVACLFIKIVKSFNQSFYVIAFVDRHYLVSLYICRSIGGGGRYDDLTGLFGVPNVPGVGISFGVDRIYDVMEELKLFPAEVQAGTQVLFFNLGEAESKAAFTLMQQLRSKGIHCEIYHENAKFDKQFKYADKKAIQYVAIIGSKELQEETCVIKNLKTGEQAVIAATDISSFVF